MRNTALILLLLGPLGCAGPGASLSKPPLPEAVTQDLPASQPGSLTKLLQDGLDKSMSDLQQLLKELRK